MTELRQEAWDSETHSWRPDRPDHRWQVTAGRYGDNHPVVFIVFGKDRQDVEPDDCEDLSYALREARRWCMDHGWSPKADSA